MATFGRLKLGAQTGYLTTNNETICAGDNLLMDGSYYYINSYAQAVPYGEGMAQPLRLLLPKATSVEIVRELPEGVNFGNTPASSFKNWSKKQQADNTPTPEKKAEEADVVRVIGEAEPKPRKEQKERKPRAAVPKTAKAANKEEGILSMPLPAGEVGLREEARELVTRLRELGYEVTASRTITCTITL